MAKVGYMQRAEVLSDIILNEKCFAKYWFYIICLPKSRSNLMRFSLVVDCDRVVVVVHPVTHAHDPSGMFFD